MILCIRNEDEIKERKEKIKKLLEKKEIDKILEKRKDVLRELS